MRKLSKNKKLNKILNNIYNNLIELGVDGLKHYKKSFPNKIDYNIYEYGNALIYTCDIINLYSEYKSLKNVSTDKIINIYKRQIRYITNLIINSKIC